MEAVNVKEFFSRAVRGVVLGVGRKREGNFALSSDISKFRTISIRRHWL